MEKKYEITESDYCKIMRATHKASDIAGEIKKLFNGVDFHAKATAFLFGSFYNQLIDISDELVKIDPSHVKENEINEHEKSDMLNDFMKFVTDYQFTVPVGDLDMVVVPVEKAIDVVATMLTNHFNK
jgi:hypothetical protein